MRRESVARAQPNAGHRALVTIERARTAIPARHAERRRPASPRGQRQRGRAPRQHRARQVLARRHGRSTRGTSRRMASRRDARPAARSCAPTSCGSTKCCRPMRWRARRPPRGRATCCWSSARRPRSIPPPRCRIIAQQRRGARRRDQQRADAAHARSRDYRAARSGGRRAAGARRRGVAAERASDVCSAMNRAAGCHGVSPLGRRPAAISRDSRHAIHPSTIAPSARRCPEHPALDVGRLAQPVRSSQRDHRADAARRRHWAAAIACLSYPGTSVAIGSAPDLAERLPYASVNGGEPRAANTSSAGCHPARSVRRLACGNTGARIEAQQPIAPLAAGDRHRRVRDVAGGLAQPVEHGRRDGLPRVFRVRSREDLGRHDRVGLGEIDVDAIDGKRAAQIVFEFAFVVGDRLCPRPRATAAALRRRAPRIRRARP